MLAAVALAAGALAGTSLTLAGEVRAPFTVSVNVVGITGTECSLSSRSTAVLVDCGGVTVIPVSISALASETVTRRVRDDRSLMSGLLRADRDGAFSERILPTAPPDEILRRRDEDDWAGKASSNLIVENGARVQSPTSFGEYSSRTLMVGNLEYLEMTVSW